LGELPTSDSVSGFNVIEDFLTFQLWKALLGQDPVEELVQLGSSIQGFGAEYFGSTDAGGWDFTLPLLLTQQYERGLAHLGDVGGRMGLLQAAHLALVLSKVVPLSNMGQNDDSVNFCASILVSYADMLLLEPSAGPKAALEYLTRIPTKARASKEVANLIAKTEDAEKLAGTPDADGVRPDSTLDKFFSKREISSILANAAEILLRGDSNRKRKGTAAFCLMLAGRYADVLTQLNAFLSPPDDPDEDRTFWMDQTRKFHDNYLSKPTHVKTTLEKEHPEVVAASKTMLELNRFFAVVTDGRYEDALKIANSLNLLPLSRTDLAAKETEYKGMDPLLKRALPSLIVGVVEALHKEHSRLKKVRSSVAQERLRDLQQQAKLLSAYSGMIGLGTQQVFELEAMMI
jgi:nuclear pore complex protein Nup93